MKFPAKIKDVLYGDNRELLTNNEHLVKGELYFFNDKIRFKSEVHSFTMTQVRAVSPLESQKLVDRRWTQVTYIKGNSEQLQNAFFMPDLGFMPIARSGKEKDSQVYQAFETFKSTKTESIETPTPKKQTHIKIVKSKNPIVDSIIKAKGSIHIGNISHSHSQSQASKEKDDDNLFDTKSTLHERRRRFIRYGYNQLVEEKEYLQREIADKLSIKPPLLSRILRDGSVGKSTMKDTTSRLVQLLYEELDERFEGDFLKDF